MPIRTSNADPKPPDLPLARHHPSSVGLYKYTIVLILYLFHPLRVPFVPRESSFYILAVSAKQLMCTECVDSNCLAIVAPSRLSWVCASAYGWEGGWRWIITPCADPAGFFRSILPTFCDKLTLPHIRHTWNFATFIPGGNRIARDDRVRKFRD